MSDLGERPSKIRKLDLPDEDKDEDKATTSDATISPIPAESNPANPTNDSLQDEEKAQDNGPALSKRALKKARKAELWEAGKEYRRTKRREKNKEKQARKADEKAKIASGELPPPSPSAETAKRKRAVRPIQVPVGLILDCDFNDYMTDKEIISLGAQLTRCYSDNRTAVYRSHMAVSSWGGKLRERFETVLANNHAGWKGINFLEEDLLNAGAVVDEAMKGNERGRLVGAIAANTEDAIEESAQNGLQQDTVQPQDGTKVKTSELGETCERKSESTDAIKEEQSSNSHSNTSHDTEQTQHSGEGVTEEILLRNDSAAQTDANAKEVATTMSIPSSPPQLIYLTSDSPHTLTSLLPGTSYIIGGIVDKNRHKGLCYKRARSLNIPTAKLPIGEYMTMQSRSVLAVNHVVEIMLKWLETGDWGEAFLSVIPKRKEARLKTKDGVGEGNDGEFADEIDGSEDGDDAQAVEVDEGQKALED